MKQQVFLITGASQGLGLELAREAVRQGAQVAMVARGQAALQAAAASLGAQALAVAADVGEEAERIVDTVLRHYGRIDVLVNNASELGPSPMPELARYPWQALQAVLHTNVVAPLHLSQLVLPGMVERQQGLLVNISSDAGVQAYPGWGGYGMSKAALEHQSRTLGEELGPYGIGVLVVDPTDMNTAMHRLAEPGVDLSHLPTPDRVAPSILESIRSARPGYQRAVAQPGVVHHV